MVYCKKDVYAANVTQKADPQTGTYLPTHDNVGTDNRIPVDSFYARLSV